MIAYNVCHEVLYQLGDNIPVIFSSSQMNSMIEATVVMVDKVSDKDLLGMKEMDSKLATSMTFYNLMWRAAFMGKPEMLPFLACRVVQHTMENGMCKHSISGFLILAALLLRKPMTAEDIDTATKIGKAAMSCFTQRYNTTELIPEAFSYYYGFVAWHIDEPLQTCAKKLGQGFDVGMSIGESDVAFRNAIQHIMTAILGGHRLSAVLKILDNYMQKADTYQHYLSKVIFSIYRGTIAVLINGGDSSHNPADAQETAPSKMLELIYFYNALRTYWQGHHSRSHYYLDKMLTLISTLNIDLQGPMSTYVIFINGLNSLELMKIKYTHKLKSSSSRAIKALKEASVHSSWNFKNKVSNIQPLDDAFTLHKFQRLILFSAVHCI
jgi:hypothetical protein